MDAVTVSCAQVSWGNARLASAGLGDRARLWRQSHGDTRGQFDHVVSIEMYETLGRAGWPAYFSTLAKRLRPGGSALIQAITRVSTAGEWRVAPADFIAHYIAPRSGLATYGELTDEARRQGLYPGQVHRFGEDYAQTLLCWRRRFDQAWPRLEAIGLGEDFRRLWAFYLAYCEAGFRAGLTQVQQIELHQRPSLTAEPAAGSVAGPA